MNVLLVQFLPVVLFFLSLTIPVCLALYIRYQRKQRRNPLTFQMLRAPGESINSRIEQLNDDIGTDFAFVGFIPLFCYSAFLSVRYLANAKISPWTYVIIALAYIIFFAYRLNRAIRQRHNEQLGLDCERAVGQELNHLMMDGCRVFHDFMADNFNIDHIVIGENGVFAIETKGRAKPNRGKGQEDVKVTYDGQSLQFPTWREQAPIEQAKRQALWLSSWLSKAVGESVSVKQALALPGWFIERKMPDLIIFNGKNPQFLIKMRTDSPLSPEMVQRISHQIEQKCRDVEPQAYKKR